MIIALLYIALNDASIGQIITQLNSYYSSNDSKAKATCFSNSGAVYLAGEFKDELIIGFNSANSLGANAGYLAKQTSNGDVPFMKSFTGSGEVFVSSIAAFGDTILVAGTYTDSLFIGTDTLINEHFKGVYIGLFDSLGNYLSSWSTSSYSAEIYDCKISPSGKIIACGEYFGDLTFGSTSLQSTLGFNFFLFSLDRVSFDPEWIEVSTGTATNAKKIDFDGVGNIFICGSYGDETLIQGNSLPNVAGDHNLFLAKYDEFGDLLLVRTLVGPVQTHGLALAVANNGDVYVGGEYEMNVDVPNIGMLSNVALMDAFIVKMNADGTFSWAQNIGTSDNDAAINIQLDINEAPIVLANAGHMLTVDGTPMNSDGFFDPILIKFDKEDGTPIWNFRIPSAPVSGIVAGYDFDLRDSMISICGSNKTGIFYAGDLLDSPNNSDSFWAIIKDTTIQQSQATLMQLSENDFSVYPNPFIDYFQVDSQHFTDSMKVELFDSKATSIKLNRYNGNKYETENALTSGFYILKITTDYGVIQKLLLHL